MARKMFETERREHAEQLAEALRTFWRRIKRFRLTWTIDHRDAMGMALRWWEGYAYSEYERRVEHFAIVPLNWIIGWWERWGRYTLQRGYRDQLYQNAFSLGYSKGHTDAYRIALKEGKKLGDQDARAEISANIDRFLEEQKAKRKT